MHFYKFFFFFCFVVLFVDEMSDGVCSKDVSLTGYVCSVQMHMTSFWLFIEIIGRKRDS